MAQQINDNFQILAALPIDDRYKKATIAERDAIPATRRYTGLKSFVDQTQTEYMLWGGITNSNWIGIAGDNISNGLETVIEGFYVLLAGKTTPLDWEVEDKFRGWISNRYVVGSIVSLPVSLPSDIDNPAKVYLSVDSIAVSGELQFIDYPQITVAATQDFTVPAGAIVKQVFVNKSQCFLETANNAYQVDTFTQVGNIFTLKKNTSVGNYVCAFYQ